MSTSKRVISFIVVAALALAIMVLPVSAATRMYIPQCDTCGSQNVSFVGTERVVAEIDEHGTHYLTFYIYQCNDCLAKMYIDSRFVS